jgi:hypothetical protein
VPSECSRKGRRNKDRRKGIKGRREEGRSEEGRNLCTNLLHISDLILTKTLLEDRTIYMICGPNKNEESLVVKNFKMPTAEH